MKYDQKTGELHTDKGLFLGKGYSGHGVGKNNPEMESVKNVGPTPKGIYKMGTPFDSDHTGPYSIPLIPDPSNNMYGRSAFLMHGDDKEHPGEASHGCQIFPRSVRQLAYATGELIHVI